MNRHENMFRWPHAADIGTTSETILDHLIEKTRIRGLRKSLWSNRCVSDGSVHSIPLLTRSHEDVRHSSHMVTEQNSPHAALWCCNGLGSCAPEGLCVGTHVRRAAEAHALPLHRSRSQPHELRCVRCLVDRTKCAEATACTQPRTRSP